MVPSMRRVLRWMSVVPLALLAGPRAAEASWSAVATPSAVVMVEMENGRSRASVFGTVGTTVAWWSGNYPAVFEDAYGCVSVSSLDGATTESGCGPMSIVVDPLLRRAVVSAVVPSDAGEITVEVSITGVGDMSASTTVAPSTPTGSASLHAGAARSATSRGSIVATTGGSMTGTGMMLREVSGSVTLL